MTSTRLLHRSGLVAGLAAMLASTACRDAAAPKPPPAPVVQTVQLNQGWSEREAAFYNHANEGTNLAPLEFVLNLPDVAKPGSKFVDTLTSTYGFIPSPKSSTNPTGLPVGFAVDERPKAVGDRAYVGITCAACHTRQLTFSKVDAGVTSSWVLPVHGGPGLVDYQRFTTDLYDAFLAVLDNDAAASQLAQGVLARDPGADDLAALRQEIREFIAPVVATRAMLTKLTIPAVDFGPGNLNALTQGNYNNLGLFQVLMAKGIIKPPPPSPPAPPTPTPHFEGGVNMPSMWFAPADSWAQWFAEIHHPGPRNWVQSVSTSPVRPPKLIAAAKEGVVVASIHFDNITQVQQSLERLRTPQWPEAVFGTLDRAQVDAGRAIYDEQCARCHTRTTLPPNELGIVFKDRPAFDVGTDATAYTQFAENVALRVGGLQRLSDSILKFRQAQLEQKFGAAAAANYMKFDSKGRPNTFALAQDTYKDNTEAKWPRSGAAYWASPMEGIFASAPYFHNGSVRTLADVLAPPEQRAKTFHTGSNEFDAEVVGLKDAGPFVYDTSQPGKGNGGHLFGTDLPADKKRALLEYLKSL